MALVVPVLRLLLLFVNVYETYKVLKRPQTQRSSRATQRKRDMKGCMTVWIVWCCIQGYERSLDSIVQIFVPFYNELKSVALLFLLLARARGAEPIFLHIIRPVVKPHAATLDWILRVSAMMGDFLFLLVSLPVYSALDWWFTPAEHGSSLVTPEEVEQRGNVRPDRPRTRAYIANTMSELQRTPHAFQAEAERSALPLVSESGLAHAHAKVREWQVRQQQNRDLRRGARAVAQGYGQSLGEGGPKARLSSKRAASTTVETIDQSSVTKLEYQIWLPPASALRDEADAGPTPTPRLSPDRKTSPLLEGSRGDSPHTPHYATDDWRVYPPFPAAYPPTPLESTRLLPSRSDLPTFPPQSEEIDHVEQSCCGSMGSLPKFANPESEGASSDMFHLTQASVDNMQVDMNVETKAADIVRATRPRRLASSRTAITTSTSATTALSTHRAASSLRTQAPSVASSSSVTGKKRPLSQKKISPVRSAHRKRRVVAPKRSAPSTPQRRRKAAQRSRVFSGVQSGKAPKHTRSEATLSGDEDVDLLGDSETEGTASKRRKIDTVPAASSGDIPAAPSLLIMESETPSISQPNTANSGSEISIKRLQRRSTRNTVTTSRGGGTNAIPAPRPRKVSTTRFIPKEIL